MGVSLNSCEKRYILGGRGDSGRVAYRCLKEGGGHIIVEKGEE